MVLASLRDRWVLFVGTWLCLVLGMALVQSDLQVLMATMPPDRGGLPLYEHTRLVEEYGGATTVVGTMMAFTVVLTIAVVGSASGFAVRQRLGDLALLRIVGYSSRQVRRLLLTESLVLGLPAALVGCPLGILVTGVQLRLLDGVGLPDLGDPPLPWWCPPVAWAVVSVVALLGVRGVARRASRVPPAVALRGPDAAAGAPTRTGRLGTALLLLLLGAFVVVGAMVGLVGATVLAIGIGIVGSLALARLSPLVVAPIAHTCELLGGRGAIPTVASADVRDDPARSRSIVLPVVLLIGMIGSLALTTGTVADSVATSLEEGTTADVVVDLERGADVRSVLDLAPGARHSVETALPVVVTLPPAGEGSQDTFASGVYAVDPADYRRVHSPEVAEGDLDALGDGVVLGPKAGSGSRGLGGEAVLEGGPRKEARPVRAVVEGTVNDPTAIVVDRSTVAPEVLDAAPTRVFLQAADPRETAGLLESLRASGIGRVETVPDWAAGRAREADRANHALLVAVLAVAGVYAVVAVITASVFGGSRRVPEFARLRLAGYSRGQVVRVTLLEATVLALTGVLLGLLVTAIAGVALAAGTARSIGQAHLAVPWAVLLAVCAVGAGAVLVTTAFTAVAATRARPVDLAMARE